MSRVAVIVVNWNLKGDTLECLKSLSQLTLPGIQLTTVVVDNGSTDGSVKAIQAKFPGIIVLEAGKNLGFTGGNNLGIDFALDHDARYIWLLNNDTLVDKRTLTTLVEVFSDNSVGIAGSKIYFVKGREFHQERYGKSDLGKVLWFAGGLIDWNNMYASHRGVDEVDAGQFDKIEETEFITGCSMLIASDVFKKIGKLDDRFFLYLEDLDFCLRAKRAGFKLLYVPQSRVWHKNAGSTDRPGHDLHEYYFTRNRLLIGLRYAPIRTKIALLREAVRFLAFGSRIRRQAIWDAILGRFGEQYIWKTVVQK